MKVPSFLKTKQGYASAIGLALAFAFGLGLYAFRDAIWVPKPAEVIPTAPVLAYRHPLTGVLIETAIVDLPQVYAVMIDNSSDAWPQSGIDKAFLVIEAPVESGIPRLEAFFAGDAVEPVEKIGPVRSARPYFVDWANEFDALYVHVGGSDAALQKIANNGTFDLNEFAHYASFWRAKDRYAPHNAFTSTERLGKAVVDAKTRGRAPDLLYGRLAFKTAATDLTKPGKGVKVAFAAPSYTVRWDHDFEKNRYTRLVGGKPFKTQTGEVIMADNVAVVMTVVKTIDGVGRKEIKTVGEGKAIVLQDGVVIEGVWKKASASERLRFYDAEGKELAMNPGVTWIEVAGSEHDVTVDEAAPKI